MFWKTVFAAVLFCFAQNAIAQDTFDSGSSANSQFGYQGSDDLPMFDGEVEPATFESEVVSEKAAQPDPMASKSIRRFGNEEAKNALSMFDAEAQPADSVVPPIDDETASAQREIVVSTLQFIVAVPVVLLIAGAAAYYFINRKQDMFGVGPESEKPFSRW